jgi:glyoxylase-like metal-dependent hydrolase (beta-lactamase superfamily II)
MRARIEAFYDEATCTITYVVFDEEDGHAIVIDPVLDFDPKSGRARTFGADKVLGFIRAQGLTLDWIVETHAHADHLSAARYIKAQAGGKIAIGENIRAVQQVFKKTFNLEPDFPADGSQFDHLFADDEVFHFGKLQGRTLFVPGHTPADMAYLIGDAVFIGDTLFMPDVGSARCDFPGGDAHALYRSVQKIFALPDQTRLFMCHDYPPAQRGPRWETTVGEQRTANIHIHNDVSEEAFVKMRTARDATLEMPTLILPAIQVNIRAGELPAPEGNGVSYLKIPILFHNVT